jgi:phosphoribosylglycinamide formyltransferase-1
MRIVGRSMIEAYPNLILNIHPALLPSFPGLDVQKQALLYGVKIAGCTVHIVSDTVDGGPIVLQAAVPVENDDSVEVLSARILKEEHRIYSQAIGLLLSGHCELQGRRIFVRD